MLINRSGTMVIPFLSVYLTQVMGYSLGQAGWVMSCFGAGSVLGSYIGGQLTDRIGFYKVQFWSLLLSGLAFIALGYVNSLPAICTMVFLTSTIADAAFAIFLQAISNPPTSRVNAVAAGSAGGSGGHLKLSETTAIFHEMQFVQHEMQRRTDQDAVPSPRKAAR